MTQFAIRAYRSSGELESRADSRALDSAVDLTSKDLNPDTGDSRDGSRA